MNAYQYDTDGLPIGPARNAVRVAETDEENEQAIAQQFMYRASRTIEQLDDAELIALADEPEFLMGCTPLELELIARLGAYVELVESGTLQ